MKYIGSHKIVKNLVRYLRMEERKNYMDENELKDLKNKAKELLNTVDSEKEISTISVAVELEGLDQVNEELDKMLIKLEKANSLADELASKLKNELNIDCSKVANLVSETIRGKASVTQNSIEITGREPYMRKDELDVLLSLISKLKPNEWNQIVLYVQKKYSSKQASVPMPSLEELRKYSVSYDFPGLVETLSECDKD